MRLFFRWSQSKILMTVGLMLTVNSIFAQDSLSYISFRDKKILYGDVGYIAAPFSLSHDFPNAVDKIKYRHNFKTSLGIGYAYKWFNLRLSLALIGNVRSTKKYGKSNYADLAVSFNIKNTYNQIGFRYYQGYVVKNAHQWIDSLDKNTPNDVSQSIATGNFYLKNWFFFNRAINTTAFDGIRAYYTEDVHGWLLNSRLEIYGVANTGDAIVSRELQDSTDVRTLAESLNAVEIGAIPGYAAVKKKENWQFGFFAALGPMIQAKSYRSENTSRAFLTIAMRYQMNLIASYQLPKKFVSLSFGIDNKTIRFNEFKFRQNYYGIRLTTGYRF